MTDPRFFYLAILRNDGSLAASRRGGGWLRGRRTRRPCRGRGQGKAGRGGPRQMEQGRPEEARHGAGGAQGAVRSGPPRAHGLVHFRLDGPRAYLKNFGALQRPGGRADGRHPNARDGPRRLTDGGSSAGPDGGSSAPSRECIVCMEPLENTPRFPTKVGRTCSVFADCAPDAPRARPCPRHPDCRGNSGICSSCERRLSQCVICRSPIQGGRPVDLPWLACSLAALFRVVLTLVVVAGEYDEVLARSGPGPDPA